MTRFAFDVGSIRERLHGRRARPAERDDIARRAAVALVVRPAGADSDVLLIRRAERADDPWSGHMAFPGGHREATDRDLLHTALRETAEEVGLDLREHEHLGQLDELPALSRGKYTGMVIAPHVFALRSTPALRPSGEVAEIVWGPLGRMARGEVDDVKELIYDGALHRLPAYRLGEHVVWGLTHYMLRTLLAVTEER